MCKNGRLVSYHHLVTDVDTGFFEIPIISQLSQMKRSPDVNPGDDGSRVSTDENKENATCQEAPVQKRKNVVGIAKSKKINSF
ncbi:hypothetical protein NA56DRAFT_708965 [Hyaloscypha hepaticicola]|uniref:Uncharacterized protein n=1 Tax=Hyaloscypha hepaticicola TaxID=2082293 RepID=A0A2J6PR49_9HELO|nr:hypothetical protein NA56DRAFT_708965 [Hyaloscypha hepaticicola]